MRNKRFLIVIAGALLFGLLAALSISRFLASAQDYKKNLGNVVVAKVDIPLGTKIIPEQLSVVQFPSGASPNGVFDSRDKLVGRVTLTNIVAREPISDYKLAPEGSAGGLSAAIPEGYRAMTVKVDDVVGISGFVMPGSLVDVVVVIDPGTVTSNQGMVSKIVLQNIKVLANGQNIDQPKDDREAEEVKTITLLVMPEQAEKLALASTEGKLRLVMRNAIDQGDAQTAGVNKRSLLSGERAMPFPDIVSPKSEKPKPASPATVARTKPSRRQEKPMAPVVYQQPPAVSRSMVEMIEGAKKRNIDLP